MRAVLAATLLIAACTGTPQTSVSPAPSPTLSAAPGAEEPCLSASISDRPAPTPGPDPAPLAEQLPGAILFDDSGWIDPSGVLSVLAGGKLRDLSPPHRMVPNTAKLTPDGRALRALVSDEASRRTYVWSAAVDGTAEELAELIPDLLPPHSSFFWSPGADRIAYVPYDESGYRELWVADHRGGVERIIAGQAIRAVAWRSSSELTVVTGATGAGATLWRWTPAGAERIGTIAITGGMTWSRDGAKLLYAGIDDQSGGSALRIREGTRDSVALRTADLLQTYLGCRIAGMELNFSGVAFGPGGQPMGSGRGPGQSLYFTAWLTAEGPRMFLVPPSCYAFDLRLWLDPARLVVPVWGPDCGADERTNRVVLVDAASGRALVQLPIERKAFVTPSPDGKWFATKAGAATVVVATDPPYRRFVIERRGMREWCCAP